MRILLELLRKLYCLFDVKQPSLRGFLVFAGVYLFVRFLDGKVKKLLFHVKSHILFLNDLQPVQVVERSDFFRFFREVSRAFVPDHRALKGIDK